MSEKRILIKNNSAYYHCMTRTVNGERLFKNREKEILRKMIWQVADFSGLQILTYCLMANHFHILVKVPDEAFIDAAELVRRFCVLYPEPTKHQVLSGQDVAEILADGGSKAESLRHQLTSRMGDLSQFMGTLKQRFSIWFNNTHDRFGTVWAERFKSVLVQGSGNPLQTMAAYIDLNPVRQGIVEDPKDYRFCGYAEAVAGDPTARAGLLEVWNGWLGKGEPPSLLDKAMQSHRMLIFGKGSSPWDCAGKRIDQAAALRVLEKERGELPLSALLRCRVRYFTDGAILGTFEFVNSMAHKWQKSKQRKRTPKATPLRGQALRGMAVIHNMRSRIFS